MPEKSISTNKLSRRQLVELDTCSKCSNCAEYCPTYIGTKNLRLIPGGKATSLSRLVKKQNGLRSRFLKPKPVTKEEIEAISSNLYACTLCGRCHEVCPFSIQTEELWRTFRQIMFDASQVPQPLQMMDGGILQKRNPYGSDADLRTSCLDYMDSSEVPTKKTADTFYFIGCTSALKAQVQDIPTAIAHILNIAGEDWTLGVEEEWCCGSPSLMVGNLERAKEHAEHNVALIKSIGAKRVVTGCPGCYRALKKYPQLLGRPLGFEVFHMVELIDQYLKDSRLQITERFKESIVYHDPCELGRLSGITEAPRAILRAITDELLEFPESKSDSRCCGGGGLLQATSDDLRLKIAEYRVAQAKRIGAKILTSACPACKMALLDAIQSKNTEMKMFDLTELVAQKLMRL
jgi:heterodisulfide reductase subunit D